jgi:hypothetical protein
MGRGVGRLKASIVPFNFHWRDEEVGSKPNLSYFSPWVVNLYSFFVEYLNVFLSYPFPFLCAYSIIGSRFFLRSIMGMWFIFLVPFFIMMVLLGN